MRIWIKITFCNQDTSPHQSPKYSKNLESHLLAYLGSLDVYCEVILFVRTFISFNVLHSNAFHIQSTLKIKDFHAFFRCQLNVNVECNKIIIPKGKIWNIRFNYKFVSSKSGKSFYIFITIQNNNKSRARYCRVKFTKAWSTDNHERWNSVGYVWKCIIPSFLALVCFAHG